MQTRETLGRALLGVELIDKLSPIPEYGETDVSPHPKIACDNLPELVIAPPSRRYEYEDETEEFYNRLEIKMKRLYQKLFLQTDRVAEDFFNDNVTDCSIDDAVGEFECHDDDDEGEVITLDDDDDDDVTTGKFEEFEEDSDANRTSETSSSANADKGLFGNREQSGVTTSTSGGSGAYRNTSASRVATESEHTEPTQEEFAEIRGNITEDSGSEESNKIAHKDVNVMPSQTFTERYGQSECSSAKSKTSSDTNEAVTPKKITVQALIHSVGTGKDFDDRAIEVMRRQKTLLEDSFDFLHRYETSNGELDLNVGRYSMEDANSTINTSVPMELESFNLSPRSSFLQEISPVLPLKRSAFAMPSLPAKIRKITDHNQRNQNKTARDFAKEIEANRTDKAVQANVNETFRVNAETLTDFPNTRDFGTGISTSFADVGTQTDRFIRFRDSGNQTEGVGTREEGTQTRRSLEYYRLFEGVNFFFVF